MWRATCACPAIPPTADVAIVVADAMQGRGPGLVDGRAVWRPRPLANGIERFSADILSDNVPAQRLMAHLTGQLERHHDGAGHSAVAADLAA